MYQDKVYCANTVPLASDNWPQLGAMWTVENAYWIPERLETLADRGSWRGRGQFDWKVASQEE